MLGCEKKLKPARPKKAQVDTNESMARSDQKTAETAETLMQSAIRAASQNDFATASDRLQELLIRDAENSKAMFLLARCKSALGKLDEALAILREIPRSDPEFGIAAVGQQAEFLSQSKRWNESIPLWRQLLSENPDLHLARASLASDLSSLQLRTEAGQELQKLAVAGAANADQLRILLNVAAPPKSRQQIVEGDGDLDALPNNDLPSTAKTLSQGWASIHEGRYRDALETLNTAENQSDDLESSQTQIDALRAWLNAELQQTDAASNILNSVTATSERFPTFWLANGILWQQQGELSQAIACFEKALCLDPTREVTHERLSAALLRSGKITQARVIDERRFALLGPVEAVLAIGPGQPDDAIASKAIVDDLIGLGRPFQAANWLRLIGPRNPKVFGSEKDIQELNRKLGKTSPDDSRLAWNGGLDPNDLPKPRPIIRTSKLKSSGNGIAITNDDLMTGPERQGSIAMSDVADAAGVSFAYRNAPIPKDRVLRLFEQLGGGIAAFDYDRDGWTDLYFAQAGGDPPDVPSQHADRLYRNVWPKLSDISEPAGVQDRNYSLGVTFGDWNQDGFWDVVVGNFGRNQLLINQGDGTFIDQSEWMEESRGMMSTSLGMADLDGDAIPDLFEVNYVDDDAVLSPVPVNHAGYPADFIGPNKLRAAVDRVAFGSVHGQSHLLPLKQGTPVPQSSEPQDGAWKSLAKLGDVAQPGLGLIIGRLNDATPLSCFVANDLRPNQCWRLTERNVGERVLVDASGPMGLAVDFQGKTTACMGVALADLNRDQAFDLVVTNWYDQWSNLYEQVMPDLFVDRAAAYGLDSLSDHHVGFGIVAADLNNDSWTDLVVGNGHVDDFTHRGIPHRMKPQILRNLRTKYSEETPTDDYFRQPHLSRCLVAADLNNDGLMDAVATDLIERAAILQNKTKTSGKWLQLELVATQSERSAVGTIVRVDEVEPALVQTVLGATGYMGRNAPALHFGLGNHQRRTVDVTVTWPSRKTAKFHALKINQRHLLIEQGP